MALARSYRSPKSLAWKATASGCRTFLFSTGAQLIATAKFMACSAALEHDRDLPGGLRAPVIPLTTSCSTHAWRSRSRVLQAAIPILVFVAVSCVAFAAAVSLDQRRARARLIRERLAATQAEGPRETFALLRNEMLSRIPALDALLRRSERVSQLQLLLDQAGLAIRAGNLLVFCVVSAVLVAGTAYVLAEPLPTREVLAFICAAAVLGLVFPYSYASWLRARRFQKFETMFPEAIDTLARAVRAGHAFTMALEIISNELSEPVGTEFRKLYEEQKYGMPVRDALINLTARMPLVDVKFFVTAVMLQRETGGNLAELLDNLSYVIRERFKILRQVRVYTAQGRLTMMLLMGMPPLIVAVMFSLNRTFIEPLFTDKIGHVLLVGGLTLQTLGYFVIRKIIRIEV